MKEDKKTRTKIKELLERQKRTLLAQLDRIKKDDPFFASDRATSNEAGVDASEIEGHDRAVALRQEVSNALDEIKKALAKLGVGTYGRCENCREPIESARLKIKPQATLCLSCEMKKERKLGA